MSRVDVEVSFHGPSWAAWIAAGVGLIVGLGAWLFAYRVLGWTSDLAAYVIPFVGFWVGCIPTAAFLEARDPA